MKNDDPGVIHSAFYSESTREWVILAYLSGRVTTNVNQSGWSELEQLVQEQLIAALPALTIKKYTYTHTHGKIQYYFFSKAP